MTKILVWIVCKIPDNPYIMLNMDASVSSPRGLAYGGGIFRDDKGVWIKGFSFYFGKNPYVGSWSMGYLERSNAGASAPGSRCLQAQNAPTSVVCCCWCICNSRCESAAAEAGAGAPAVAEAGATARFSGE